ncbi:MAG: YbhB/YbcL family Raf kinase inhibitor-like protein [Anaerotignum sp.]|nr:YbhB/YbcL family Raf kinase inhibitor-like protein [Anaerotignum sp.]
MENKLILRSRAFMEGERIPLQYTGRGEDVSPPLMMENIHPRAKSIAITMDDLDIPFIKCYNHWIIWNIPICNSIPEGIPFGKKIDVPFSAVQGLAYGKHGYRGPKPPRMIKNRHRYVFTAYVLDCMCELPAESKKKQWWRAVDGHILQQASLCGSFCNADQYSED